MSEEREVLAQAPGGEPPLLGARPVVRHRGRATDPGRAGEAGRPGIRSSVGGVREAGTPDARPPAAGPRDAGADAAARMVGLPWADGGRDGRCASVRGPRRTAAAGRARGSGAVNGRADAGGAEGAAGSVRARGRHGAGVRLAMRAAHAAEGAEVHHAAEGAEIHHAAEGAEIHHAAEGAEIRADGIHAEVGRFADRSLRAVLEVLDRRRPVGQLAGIADPLVLAAVRTLVTGDLAPRRELGPAILAGVRVRPVGADAAELCAGYERGGRRFALAARAVRGRRTGWRLTALRVR